jgi:predicted enzyme related to lactoylglutathione lyase
MEKQTVKRMTGLIMSSADPNRLATFYKDVLGLPLTLNKHGNLPEHWECDFEGIHYAILKDRKNEVAASNFVPSFEVDDINEFVKRNNLAMLHPLMNLGNGDFVGSIADVDGNVVRLWMTIQNKR